MSSDADSFIYVGVRTSHRAARLMAIVLTAAVVVAALALLPLDPTRYQAAIAAIGTVMTVGAIGLAAVGLAADHSRQRSDATLNFLNSVLDEDRERVARINRWLKDSGVTKLTAQQAIEIRSAVPLRPLHDDLRAYLNHLERLSLGVRTGIFDPDIVKLLSRTRLVNARHRFACYLDEAAGESDLAGTKTKNFEHLRWLVDQHWKA